MHQKPMLYLITGMIFMLWMTGCSGGNIGIQNDFINGDESENPSLNGKSGPDAQSAHYPLGTGRIYFDNESGEVSCVPDRTVAKHYNVMSMAQFWISKIVIDNNNGVTRDWHLTVWLKNTSTTLGGYNIRAIFFPHEFIKVINYTGFTKVFGGGFAHPFINWFKYNWKNEDNWPPGFQLGKEIIFRIPISWGFPQLTNKAYLDYAIDACFPGPIQESPYLLDEYVTQHGVWHASGIDGYMEIPVCDWQRDIKQVVLDLTPINPVIGKVTCVFHHSDPLTNNSLQFYHANVQYNSSPPSIWGKHRCTVIVTDTVSQYELYADIEVNIDWDTSPPESYSGGTYKGLLDLIAGDGFIRFYSDRAVDPSGVLYIFYHNPNASGHAWDGSADSYSDCDPFIMNWPAGYPACLRVLSWANGNGNMWSVDAWDGPVNKAHTTSEKWARPSRPVKRWLKLAGNLGDQNTNYGSPVMVDMDNDGGDDIVIANRMGAVYCFDGVDGGSPSGVKWIFNTNDVAVLSSPAAYDCTGDGIPEIYITTNGLDDGRIWCIRGDAGTEKWSYTTPDVINAACSLADMDNDGGLDVIAGDSGGRLYVLDGESGLPIWSDPFIAGGGFGGTAAAAKVNGDNIPDIAIGAYDGKVYLINGADGTKIWEYSAGTALFSVESSPAMYDANGDTVPDVVFGANDRVYCLNGAGIGGGQTSSIWVTDFLVTNFSGSPAIGDCNLDGIPDVVIMGLQGNGNDLFIIDGANGNALWGINFPGKVFSNVILADATGDGHLNAIFGVNDPAIADTERYYIVNVDRVDYGIICVDMPTTLITDQALGMPNAPTLGDIDNDGLWDMAFGSEQGRVFVHSLGTKIPTDPSLRPWTTFHGNDRRDGLPFENY